MKVLTNAKPMTYNGEKPVKCECGKVIARVRDGKVYIYCKSCKRQVAIVDLEPRAK